MAAYGDSKTILQMVKLKLLTSQLASYKVMDSHHTCW